MRQILLLVVPLLVPVTLYMLWFDQATRRARAAGREPPGLGDVPWITLAIAGAVLAGISLGAWRYGGGAPANLRYQPPKFIDGAVVPGGVASPKP